MASALQKMNLAELVYEVSLCKIADEEHVLYAAALAREVERRVKAAKAKGKKVK